MFTVGTFFTSIGSGFRFLVVMNTNGTDNNGTNTNSTNSYYTYTNGIDPYHERQKTKKPTVIDK